ncbi:MAG TPA: hypothetical protein VFQ13_12320 [Anaerolineales bacterium]|nr:hypothetical protein [Anaerolineales bacterium]
MSEPNQTNPSPDDLLADFTDHVLDGEISVPASRTDDELRGLEETVLRLKQSIPQAALDEKTLKRMQADFKVRARKSDSSRSSLWQALRPRQRFALAFAGVTLAALLIVFPLLTSANEPVQGTAGFQPQTVLLGVGIASLIVLLVWASRRK